MGIMLLNGLRVLGTATVKMAKFCGKVAVKTVKVAAKARKVVVKTTCKVGKKAVQTGKSAMVKAGAAVKQDRQFQKEYQIKRQNNNKALLIPPTLLAGQQLAKPKPSVPLAKEINRMPMAPINPPKPYVPLPVDIIHMYDIEIFHTIVPIGMLSLNTHSIAIPIEPFISLLRWEKTVSYMPNTEGAYAEIQQRPNSLIFKSNVIAEAIELKREAFYMQRQQQMPELPGLHIYMFAQTPFTIHREEVNFMLCLPFVLENEAPLEEILTNVPYSEPKRRNF